VQLEGDVIFLAGVWMENYPLHLVKKIAAGGKEIDPAGQKVALAELARRESTIVDSSTTTKGNCNG